MRKEEGYSGYSSTLQVGSIPGELVQINYTNCSVKNLPMSPPQAEKNMKKNMLKKKKHTAAFELCVIYSSPYRKHPASCRDVGDGFVQVEEAVIEGNKLPVGL